MVVMRSSNFLLAEIENTVGKILFIFAGYNKEMEKFLKQMGQGSSARDFLRRLRL